MSYKVIIVGDSGVGKTSILNIFLGLDFNLQQQITIGVDYGIKKLNINNSDIKLQIWDTAGQEVFRSISKSYYRGADGAFVVFDLSRRKTFLNIEYWIKELYNQNSNVHVMIIGSKSDMVKQVSDDEIDELITKFNAISYIETSAKNKYNIDTIFYNMASKIHNKHENTKSKPNVELISHSKAYTCCNR